jgi:hypothetical protein
MIHQRVEQKITVSLPTELKKRTSEEAHALFSYSLPSGVPAGWTSRSHGYRTGQSTTFDITSKEVQEIEKWTQWLPMMET